jgi:hypothetical protein
MNIRATILAGAAAASILGLGFAGAANAATNLITNGSFETGNTFAWTYSGAVGDPFPATIIGYNNTNGYPTGAFGELIPPDNSISGSPDPVGDYAAYFVSDFAAAETLSQDVLLAAGIYSIGFSVYIPFNGQNNPNDAHFSGSVAGQELVSFNVGANPAGVWTHYYDTLVLNAPGTFTTAFTFATDGNPAKDIIIDRVYLVAGDIGAVPEPTTWVMMLTGFFGMGAMLRRRRYMALAA